jgi:hypothetical protein
MTRRTRTIRWPNDHGPCDVEITWQVDEPLRVPGETAPAGRLTVQSVRFNVDGDVGLTAGLLAGFDPQATAEHLEMLDRRAVSRLAGHGDAKPGHYVSVISGTEVPVPRRPGRPTVYTDDVLIEVAEIYRAAQLTGRAPTKAVAEAKQMSHSTAAKVVAKARKAGHLAQTKRGRVSRSALAPDRTADLQ